MDDLDDYFPEPERFLDVPFVPTDDGVIKAMLNLARVNSKDVLYDLGSGDGRILIMAARQHGTRGIGIELDPSLIADGMEEAAHFGVECQVDFIEEDIFKADCSEATVVTLYLLDTINIRLRPLLLNQLRPGARIVSHAFDMGDWKADEQIESGGITIYKWIVPAQVEGVWEWDGVEGTPYRVELEQKYQCVTGRAWVGDEAALLKSARLCGTRLEVEIQTDMAVAPHIFALTIQDSELQSVVDET